MISLRIFYGVNRLLEKLSPYLETLLTSKWLPDFRPRQAHVDSSSGASDHFVLRLSLVFLWKKLVRRIITRAPRKSSQHGWFGWFLCEKRSQKSEGEEIHNYGGDSKEIGRNGQTVGEEIKRQTGEPGGGRNSTNRGEHSSIPHVYLVLHFSLNFRSSNCEQSYAKVPNTVP